MANSNTRNQQETAADEQTKKERPGLKGDKPDGQKRKWDIIDEHAWESFPASDPPASWAGRDIPPEERSNQEPEKPAATPTEKQAQKKQN